MLSHGSDLVLGVFALVVGAIWGLTVLAHDLPLFLFVYLDVWYEWFVALLIIDVVPTVLLLLAGCYLMYKWYSVVSKKT